MTKKAKSKSDGDRRDKVEAMRRETQARERRKTLLVVAVAVLVGLGLVAAAIVPSYLKSKNDPANKALSTFGVTSASARCGPNISDKSTGQATHKPVGTKIKYKQVPPSSGPHALQPVSPAKAFYTQGDRPAMEQLVHNLEHGYTIVWYDSTIKGSQLQALKDISAAGRQDAATGNGKFIVSSWDSAYGKLPAGKHVAMSHWAAEGGKRQLCGQVSGSAIGSFIRKFPAADSTEPNAA